MVSELIARLEAADDGTATLDRLIRDAFNLPAMLVPPDGGDDAYPYTTALDAALTLVPEGWRIANMKDGLSRTRADKRLCCQISLWRPANPSLGHGFQSVGATPPLALCIAALKARAA